MVLAVIFAHVETGQELEFSKFHPLKCFFHNSVNWNLPEFYVVVVVVVRAGDGEVEKTNKCF